MDSTRITDDELADFWHSALAEPVGLCLEIVTGDLERLRQRLYQVRQKLQDPDLHELFLAPDPDRPKTHLWITKKKVTINVEG